MNAVIAEYIHEGILAVALSVGSYVILFPIRNFFKTIKAEWYSAADKLAKVQAELEAQRTNCLTTLQAQGDTQIGLLQKAVDTLGDMHLDQKETLGFLRGQK